MPIVLLALAILTTQAQRTTKAIPSWGDLETFSSLHPGQSDLVTVSYLVQGLPNAVFGTLFCYDNPEAKIWEDLLSHLLVRPSVDGKKDIPCALRYLANRTYTTADNTAVIVIKGNERVVYTGGLQTELKSDDLTATGRTLANALIRYFAPTRSKRNGDEVSDPIISNNVAEVLKSVVITTKTPKGAKRFGIYR